MNNNHFEIAKKEIGIHEFKNGDNPRILEYHQATELKATADEISWCAAFVNWCLKESGEQGTNKADARSFLGWGIPVVNPKEGDIVVFWRGQKQGWQGHVAFFVSQDDDGICVLGGNQHDKVCYSVYPKYQLLGFRRLS
jgi:uncharacterized protein (TIGR02594 family)